MLHVLRDQPAAVPFFQFVVNPSSFTQTVENIFDLSFLVKQERAEVFMREGTPHVGACRFAPLRATVQPGSDPRPQYTEGWTKHLLLTNPLHRDSLCSVLTSTCTK